MKLLSHRTWSASGEKGCLQRRLTAPLQDRPRTFGHIVRTRYLVRVDKVPRRRWPLDQLLEALPPLVHRDGALKEAPHATDGILGGLLVVFKAMTFVGDAPGRNDGQLDLV